MLASAGRQMGKARGRHTHDGGGDVVQPNGFPYYCWIRAEGALPVSVTQYHYRRSGRRVVSWFDGAPERGGNAQRMKIVAGDDLRVGDSRRPKAGKLDFLWSREASRPIETFGLGHKSVEGWRGKGAAPTIIFSLAVVAIPEGTEFFVTRSFVTMPLQQHQLTRIFYRHRFKQHRVQQRENCGLAPIPTARVRIATTVKPRDFASTRSAYRKSCKRICMASPAKNYSTPSIKSTGYKQKANRLKQAAASAPAQTGPTASGLAAEVTAPNQFRFRAVPLVASLREFPPIELNDFSAEQVLVTLLGEAQRSTL